ncbi:MAG: DUF6033 family protein [Lachnospiraceae bacterium]|nr:DUF6033 family protein [Lachnospiraceae bacterium]
MNGINSYQAYRDGYATGKTAYDAYAKGGKVSKDTKRTKDLDAPKDVYEKNSVGKENKVTLSKRAQNLLEELKKKYGNMDFVIADYESEEEAAQYLAGSTKEYSVLIDPETLEEMAADEEVKNQYLGALEEATGKLPEIREQLGDKAEFLKSLGIALNKDGKLSFFAKLELSNENKKYVYADSMEKLMEKIEELNTDSDKEKNPVGPGQTIDYSV